MTAQYSKYINVDCKNPGCIGLIRVNREILEDNKQFKCGICNCIIVFDFNTFVDPAVLEISEYHFKKL